MELTRKSWNRIVIYVNLAERLDGMVMLEIGAFEAKNRLSELIRKVQCGERVMITHRGRPAAILTPPEPDTEKAGAAIDALMAFGDRCLLHLEEGETVRSLMEEGRR